MAISTSPRFDQHLNHQVVIKPGSGQHAWRLVCRECDTHLQWLSDRDCQALVDAGFREIQDH